MADKDFGIKRLNLVGASGTPTITSPTDLIIRANNVAISTNSTIGGNLGIGTTNPTSKLTVQGDVLISGVLTARNIVGTSLSISGISTIANFLITNVGTGATVGGIGVVTYYGDGSGLTKINSSSIVGVATYADRSGIATNVIGGIASVTSLDVSGITTLASIVGTSLSITGISTIANFRITNVGTGATVGGIGVTYYGDGSQLENIAVDYADRAGIATNVIGGIASVTSLDVSGITTLASIVGTSLSITGISTLGITSTANLTSQQLNVSGILTASRIVGTSLSISGISTIANFIMTPVGTGATVGGIGVTYYGDGRNLTNIVSSYATTAGIATNVIGGIASVTSLDVSGITTLASIVGTSLSITGISTIANFRITNVGTGATVGGIGVVTYYGDGSGLTKINSSAIVGVATYADRAGIATNVIGGIASVSQLNVSGITTLASIVGTSLSITGISTIANFRITNVGTGATVGGIGVTYYGDGSQLTNINSSSIVGVITYADNAGIATNVIGGIASVTSLNVTGITTLASIVGTSLSITGISTIANFRITNVGTGATVGGVGVLTYYGDGSQLTGLIAGVSISTNTANQSQLIPYVTGTGSTTGFGVTTLFTYNPSSGNLGIGTTNPTSKLTVQGDVLVSGILTASSIVGTSLSISGISTIANFRMSPVGTGATVGGIGVTYYGDGSNLTNVVGAFGGIGTAGGTVGTGITFLDFRGSGISSITVSSGIATITIPGASRSVNSYVAEEGETSFLATYTPEYADVYLNGSKLSETEYTATNGTSIELTEPASAGDIVEIVSYLINITGGSSTPDISPVMMGMIF